MSLKNPNQVDGTVVELVDRVTGGAVTSIAEISEAPTTIDTGVNGVRVHESVFRDSKILSFVQQRLAAGWPAGCALEAIAILRDLDKKDYCIAGRTGTVEPEEAEVIPTSEPVHLTNAAIKLIDEWKKDGFNQVRFAELYVTDRERVPDEETEEQYQDRRRDVVYFVANPDIYFNRHWVGESHDYESLEVDDSRFFADMTAEVQKRFGSDVEVSYRRGCHEFEAIRRKRETFEAS